jgi:hypothetical protein
MNRIKSHPLFHPLFLLLLCFLAYGLLIPWLGFYADDWILLWIYQKLGPWGVNYYHITNRPFLAPLYQILLPLLGAEPWRWQIFAVIAPWLTSLSGWWLVKNLWPKRVIFALYVSILIAVFPGYLSHAVALNTGHRNIILAIFFVSLTLTILSIRHQKYFWLFFPLALLTCIFNMLAMEYFLLLEFLRPFVIWIVLAEKNYRFKEQLRKTLIHFIPFFLAFCLVMYWRGFVFEYQTRNFSFSLFELVREDPLSAFITLLKQLLLFAWTGTIRVWIEPVLLFFKQLNLSASSAIYFVVTIIGALFVFLVLNYFPVKDQINDSKNKNLFKDILFLSVPTWLLGGLPFILVGLQPGIQGFETRYNLPYMLLSCLWAGTLIVIIIKKYRIQILVLSLLVGFSIGSQFLSSFQIRAMDESRRSFFWNLSYRIPDLQPGTLILTNTIPTADGTSALSYILNWLYRPDLSSNSFPYLLVNGSQLSYQLDPSRNSIMIIGAHFNVDWSKVIFLNSSRRNCPQIYNPDFPLEFPAVDERSQGFLPNANLKPVLTAPQNPAIDPSKINLGSEPLRGWCYYFEKADLARQMNDWQSIKLLGDDAIFTKGLKFLTDTELIPFIQGYALEGEWNKALVLLNQSVDFQINKEGVANAPLVESTWEFIDKNTPSSAEKSIFEKRIREILR